MMLETKRESRSTPERAGKWLFKPDANPSPGQAQMLIITRVAHWAHIIDAAIDVLAILLNDALEIEPKAIVGKREDVGPRHLLMRLKRLCLEFLIAHVVRQRTRANCLFGTHLTKEERRRPP